MIDFIFISTVINLAWSIFGFIFFLYKFTSILSYIYNFSRFCNKLVYSISWLKNKCIEYIFPSPHDSDSEDSESIYSDNSSPHFFQRIKNYFIQKHTYNIPQYNSTHINNSSYFTNHLNENEYPLYNSQHHYTTYNSTQPNSYNHDYLYNPTIDSTSVYLNFNKSDIPF